MSVSETLRKLNQSDLNDLLEIETKVHIAPWTEEAFLQCFEPGYEGWLIEINNKIIGFIIVSLLAQECHILNLCINIPFQRRGFGRQLLEHALTQARMSGATIAYLEVRRSNLKAITLYRDAKFHLVGERKNYYPNVGGAEDALIFVKSLAV